MILLNTEKVNWFNLNNSKIFRILFYGFILDLILIIIFFSLKEMYFFLVFLIPLFFSLVRVVSCFNIYLYKVEIIDNKEVILYYLHWGVKKSKKTSVNNFKLRYFYNTKLMPVIIFEQNKPYKFIFKQYCYGYWTKKVNIEIFRPYVREIKYYD